MINYKLSSVFSFFPIIVIFNLNLQMNEYERNGQITDMKLTYVFVAAFFLYANCIVNYVRFVYNGHL